jgi:hypothetical protein
MMRVRKEESRSRCGRIWLIFKLRLNISHNRAFGLDVFFLRFLSTHQLLAVQLRGATRSRYHPCVTRFLTTNSSRFNCEEHLLFPPHTPSRPHLLSFDWRSRRWPSHNFVLIRVTVLASGTEDISPIFAFHCPRCLSISSQFDWDQRSRLYQEVSQWSDWPQ